MILTFLKSDKMNFHCKLYKTIIYYEICFSYNQYSNTTQTYFALLYNKGLQLLFTIVQIIKKWKSSWIFLKVIRLL